MNDKQKAQKLREALLLLLDQVDYTNHACRLTDMVGACLDHKIIKKVREILEETKP